MQDEVYGIIYYFRNKINNKIYFGQTIKTFDERYKRNKDKIIDRVTNEHLARAIKKYGIDNFEINKQFDVAYSKEELDALEDLYICIYNTTNDKYGYNKKRGGANPSLCEESRKKISETLKQKYKDGDLEVPYVNPMKGKHWNDRQREICGNSWTGKKQPPEMVAKRKARMQGKNGGGDNPVARKVICLNTGEVFECVKYGANKYNCGHSGIVKCCKNERFSTGTHPKTKQPLTWLYYEDYIEKTEEEIQTIIQERLSKARPRSGNKKQS